MFSWRKHTFARGIHPEGHKSTAGMPIRRMPFAPRMILPLAQHIGKPAVPLVRAGEEVVRGQPIARADGLMSLPLHAPADGVIESIELKPSARGPWVEAIVMRVYEASTQEVRWATPPDIDSLTPAQITQAIQDAGIAGMGGAAFPAHVKLTPPKGSAIHTLIVNGAECEPYLTCDHRVMLEQPRDVMRGIQLALRACGAPKAVIGIEDNKPDAVAMLNQHAPADGSIRAQAVKTKYPQGAEATLIYAITGQEVPRGARCSQVGVLMNNVQTMAYMGRLIPAGEGVIERVVTVAGPGVERPGNYLVPIGTPMRYLLEFAGARDAHERQIIMGGPMMGESVASLDVPVVKGTSGILVMPDLNVARPGRLYPCIKCGECVNVCPKGLNPSMLGMLAGAREYDLMAADYALGECFECGCCSYVCPSHIPLVQQFRVAKGVLRERAAG